MRFCIVLALASGLAMAPVSHAATDMTGRTITWIAHRGAIGQAWPENTLAAFRYAIDNDVDAIEIDLRGTRDGEIVVIHDKTVDRTTNGHGAVKDLSLAELARLDAGRGERIPRFEEVLKLVSGTAITLVIDIKKDRALNKEKVVRQIEEHDAVRNIIVGVRTRDDLHAFQTLNRGLRTVGFINELEDTWTFIEAGVDIVRLWPEWIDSDPGLIERVHQLGKPVWATTGDAPRDELERLIGLGVDGILSDLPEVMKALVADKKRHRKP